MPWWFRTRTTFIGRHFAHPTGLYKTIVAQLAKDSPLRQRILDHGIQVRKRVLLAV